jgi:hypothetical protein
MAGNPQTFVEAAAQIIPVLVLAMVADPVNRERRVGQSGLILLALIAGVSGEVLALLAVDVGTEHWVNVAVSWSLAILAFAIIWPHGTAHWKRFLSPLPPRWRVAIRGGLFAVYIWGYALYLGLNLFPPGGRLFLVVTWAIGMGVAVWRLVAGFRGLKKVEIESPR